MELKSRLLEWYEHARRDLPWRRTRDPYAVWVSETMLQQTRVDTVLPYYERFVRELPTVAALAQAPESQVLALWSGLGYYRRARMLHAAAKRVVGVHGGRLPGDATLLQSLEGVGRYTAGAVASIAFGIPAAVVDGNVARVLARLYAIADDVKGGPGHARVWSIAETLVSAGEGDPGAWNQALMELGATVCVPRTPRCEGCPVRNQCAANAQGLALSLPRVTAKRPPTAVHRVALVLFSSRAVVLARRRPDVLFGGLWEAPTGGADVTPVARRLGVDLNGLESAGRFVHVLSHRRMHVEVVRGRLGRRRSFAIPGPEYEAVNLVPWEAVPGLAHASLTRKVLEVANAGGRGLPWK